MTKIDVVDLVHEPDNQIVVRFPNSGEADLKLGTTLSVREGEVCIFSRGSEALDTFGPGRHTLAADNLPLLNKAGSLPSDGDTPFAAECYFINLRSFLNQKWETVEPMDFQDRVLEGVRLTARGLLSFRVSDPRRFVDRVVFAAGHRESEGVAGLLRDIVVGRLSEVLGDSLETLLDLAAEYDELQRTARDRIHADFATYGVELEGLVISAIRPPSEVQARIHERAGLGIFDGDMRQQRQMASALRDMAQSEGGESAGRPPGGSPGAGMGFMMPPMVAGAMPPEQAPQQGYPQPGRLHRGYPEQPGHPSQSHGYPQPGEPPPQSGFTPQQPAASQAPAAPQASYCGACAQALTPGFKFCAHCGAPVVE